VIKTGSVQGGLGWNYHETGFTDHKPYTRPIHIFTTAEKQNKLFQYIKSNKDNVLWSLIGMMIRFYHTLFLRL
jgi:hypothetical protein